MAAGKVLASADKMKDAIMKGFPSQTPILTRSVLTLSEGFAAMDEKCNMQLRETAATRASMKEIAEGERR